MVRKQKHIVEGMYEAHYFQLTVVNSRKFKNCTVPLQMYGRLMILQHQESHIGFFFFFFSISRISANFDCTPIFSDRLYCTSEGKAYLFIVRSEMYQLYEVKVNGDHKSANLVQKRTRLYKNKLISK